MTCGSFGKSRDIKVEIDKPASIGASDGNHGVVGMGSVLIVLDLQA
jgi:hypothetical protein